jgi:hypothetical protein
MTEGRVVKHGRAVKAGRGDRLGLRLAVEVLLSRQRQRR